MTENYTVGSLNEVQWAQRQALGELLSRTLVEWLKAQPAGKMPRRDVSVSALIDGAVAMINTDLDETRRATMVASAIHLLSHGVVCDPDKVSEAIQRMSLVDVPPEGRA